MNHPYLLWNSATSSLVTQTTTSQPSPPWKSSLLWINLFPCLKENQVAFTLSSSEIFGRNAAFITIYVKLIYQMNECKQTTNRYTLNGLFKLTNKKFQADYWICYPSNILFFLLSIINSYNVHSFMRWCNEIT